MCHKVRPRRTAAGPQRSITIRPVGAISTRLRACPEVCRWRAPSHNASKTATITSSQGALCIITGTMPPNIAVSKLGCRTSSCTEIYNSNALLPEISSSSAASPITCRAPKGELACVPAPDCQPVPYRRYGSQPVYVRPEPPARYPDSGPQRRPQPAPGRTRSSASIPPDCLRPGIGRDIPGPARQRCDFEPGDIRLEPLPKASRRALPSTYVRRVKTLGGG
jgi:hypothetical protein